MKKISQKHIAIILSAFAALIGIWLIKTELSLVWYWIFGLAFGAVLQRSRVCFVTATSDPFISGATDQIRALLIGVLVSSLGITSFKYLSNGTFDLLGVSAISFPLILGAFMFGIGMILAGCCSSGMFIRLAEGYGIHLITFICVLIGYFFANSHYQTIWAPFILKAPVVFLPELTGSWATGIIIHILIVLVLYFATLKLGHRVSPSDNSSFLKGTISLGILSAIHIVILESGWSVTGAFFWIKEFFSGNVTALISGANIRNGGLFAGALISVLLSAQFHFKKIRSAKQVGKSVIGGLLMGYGACIASGCNINAFFVAASCLSLSGWVFAASLFAGAFVGVKLLYKLI